MGNTPEMCCNIPVYQISNIRILSHPSRNAALREVVRPPLCSEQQDDDRDPDPCPSEDEELFDAPDAESMEEAINKFVDGFPEAKCWPLADAILLICLRGSFILTTQRFVTWNPECYICQSYAHV
jgi:hypothetical protein